MSPYYVSFGYSTACGAIVCGMFTKLCSSFHLFAILVFPDMLLQSLDDLKNTQVLQLNLFQKIVCLLVGSTQHLPYNLVIMMKANTHCFFWG